MAFSSTRQQEVTTTTTSSAADAQAITTAIGRLEARVAEMNVILSGLSALLAQLVTTTRKFYCEETGKWHAVVIKMESDAMGESSPVLDIDKVGSNEPM